MKMILSFILLATSFMVYAQTADKTGIKETESKEAESASRRILQKKRDRSYTGPQIRQEREEEKPVLNNDADPELDAVDDDLTKDEGLNDD